MAPKDFKELEKMMEFAVKLKSPVVIRYPRGGEAKEKFMLHTPISQKKCEILTSGNDVTILAIGNQVSKAMNICKKLKEENIKAEVINVRFLKPFDKYNILNSIVKTKFVVTLEDNILIGGLGSEVKELIIEKGLKNIKIKSFGYPDVFIEHGLPEEIEKKYKMDEKTILNYIIKNKEKSPFKNNNKYNISKTKYDIKK